MSLIAWMRGSSRADLQGFDNGWWGTILGSAKFLKDYGSCVVVDGVETCNLSTSQLSAGSAVQSAGISECIPLPGLGGSEARVLALRRVVSHDMLTRQ